MSDLGPILPLVATFVRHKIVYLAVRQHTCFREKVVGSGAEQLVWQWIKEER